MTTTTEEVLISNLLTENDLTREISTYTDLGEYGGYTELTDDVRENGLSLRQQSSGDVYPLQAWKRGFLQSLKT